MFSDKIVLVTGSTRGIGRGIALAFAREGASVVINGTRENLCRKVAEEIMSAGGRAFEAPGDISDALTVHQIFQKILEKFGKIDILVNNAGIIYVVDCIDTTDEQWDRTMAVNCRGVFLCSREAAGYMMMKKSGKIINVSSQLGKTGEARYTHYCASKFAVIGFTQALAKELAINGITVNAICPGIVDTDMMDEELKILKRLTGKATEVLRKDFLKMIPLGRYEAPDDVADLVLFLASDKASYITGQAINVTGGFEMH